MTTSEMDSATSATVSLVTTAAQTSHRRISLQTYRLRALQTTSTGDSLITLTTASTITTTSMTDSFNDYTSFSPYTRSRGASCSDCSICTDHDQSPGRTKNDDELEPLSPPAKRARLEYNPIRTSPNDYETLFSPTMPLYSPTCYIQTNKNQQRTTRRAIFSS